MNNLPIIRLGNDQSTIQLFINCEGEKDLTKRSVTGIVKENFFTKRVNNRGFVAGRTGVNAHRFHKENFMYDNR